MNKIHIPKNSNILVAWEEHGEMYFAHNLSKTQKLKLANKLKPHIRLKIPPVEK